jgi:uncharacterized protein (DUF433 family)
MNGECGFTTALKLEAIMQRVDWQEYITIDPELHHGDACIKGTRIPVATIVGSLADGLSSEEIIAAYPQLETVQIQAALAYAADMLQHDLLLPLTA